MNNIQIHNAQYDNTMQTSYKQVTILQSKQITMINIMLKHTICMWQATYAAQNPIRS